ncbi:MAG: 2-oxo acid dehydrogenase subunit E2, partial [Burkholderiaceae bacterium]
GVARQDAVADDQPAAVSVGQLNIQTEDQDRIFASPLARRMAGDEGVDLSALLGSGPLGRVVERDIEAAKFAMPRSIKGDSVPGVAHAFGIPSTHKDVPHSTMRRTIARRLVESKSTIPHFYLTADCRVDKLMALRAEFNAAAARKVSVNDFIVKAVALALRELPDMNVGWSDTALHYYDQADISIAVSTENGLQTPIVYAVDTKSVTAIGAEIAGLAARARDGKLTPEEYQGGNFTISNLGMYGVREFVAIINPPQSAILAVGAAELRPIVQEGAIVAASMMTVTLSVDHRAIDGVLAAKWLAVLKRILENPLSTLA